MHSKKVTARVISIYFLKKNIDLITTVHGEHCNSMNTNLFWLKLEKLNTNEMQFYQFGAIGHTAYATLDILMKWI